MFRNFGKVFSFSFHNQAGTKSYKMLTVIVALILFLVPFAILFFMAKGSEDEEKELESCGAERIYIVSDFEAEPVNFMALLSTEENYKGIRYAAADSVEDAMEKTKEGEASFILYFYPEEDYIRADIIVPAKSSLSTEEAGNYFDFLSQNQTGFSLLLSGISQGKLESLTPPNAFRTYTAEGYEKGISTDEDTAGTEALLRDQVMSAFQMIIPYFTMMLLYFMIMSYGNSLAQSVVMEKESKLMDTMLISLHPEALVFGKLLAAILAGLIQIFLWVGCVVAGLIVGTKVTESLYPDYVSPMKAFFGFLEELNVFRPENVALGVLFLIFGFVMYEALASIAGAISANREEVASQSFLFVMPLLAAFLLAMMGGGLTAGGAPEWLLYIPFSATLLMPSTLALGQVSLVTAGISLALLIVFTLLFVIGAGRIYKMMSLYKGNKVSIGQVLKRLAGKE
ncbi:MAG: ABC transporter permease [Lachnospiraceae bacterium]|nr:ABC transporter permease [Lachnospiraceae bacterium]